MERRLCGTILPRRRWPLRRKSQPDADAQPVSSHPQTRPGQSSGAIPREPGGDRTGPHQTRHSLCGRQLGIASAGAWGLGWEVWLDGQEITQFTYFQQAGSLALEPVSVEITYGLDRIVMYLQNKTDVWSIDVDGAHTFGEVYAQPEVENCVYNFELADVERLKRLYEIYELEAQACIARGLVVPAYDFVLRQSHTFNLLDARGAVGVTERAKYFARMRGQSRAISELYVEQRQREEYPWLNDSSANGSQKPSVVMPPAESSNATPDLAQDLLLELGSEELPPHDVVHGISQIRELLAKLLESNRLAYGELHVTGTTRRLVAHVRDLAPMQNDEISEKRGPSLDRAYDAVGAPTRAAEGFARGQGVNVQTLEVRDNYVYAVKRVKGQPASNVLPALCTELLDSLRWGKTMRWNESGVGYPRPLRWIVALHGASVVPFIWAGVSSGRISRGPRFADAAAQLATGEFTTLEIADTRSYFDKLSAIGVTLDRDARRAGGRTSKTDRRAGQWCHPGR
ncbi:MAG: glycine--tRNA ligase subunit alpha [Caldilineaceae bacterium]|nr:glycine--tRNA ligase subunit alpha [Caldilineaceae bacterium]